MGRYTRDEICLQGLELASCPGLTKQDAPGGILDPNAKSIKWLQNALDYFHRKYPFASDILDVDLTIQVNNVDAVLTADPTKYLPTDFIVDVRDGIDVTFNGAFSQIFRKDYRTWRLKNQASQSGLAQRPEIYTRLNNRIKVLPKVSEPLSAVLHYYALPAVLETDSPVPFPDEWILIEFIRLKALEWVRTIELLTAQKYLDIALAGLIASGLLNEPEHEGGVPLENNQVIIDGAYNRNSWMGPTVS